MSLCDFFIVVVVSFIEVIHLSRLLWFVFWLACHPVFFVYKYIIEVIPHRAYVILKNASTFQEKQTRVVIIGGGFLGTVVASTLANHKGINITLIDKRHFFEYTPSCVRVAVNPNHKSVIHIDHQKYLRGVASVIESTVTFIDPTHSTVTLDSQMVVPYDFLVVGTGTSYQWPNSELAGIPNGIKADNCLEMCTKYTRLVDASNVLIIGGGTTGVEVAAEIITKFPNKQVTIVQSGDTLLPSYSRTCPKVVEYVKEFFYSKGVNIIYGHRIISPFPQPSSFSHTSSSSFSSSSPSLSSPSPFSSSPTTSFLSHPKSGFLTDKNKVIEADVAYLCCCGKPNNSLFVNNNLLKKFVLSSGFVSTNSHFQIEEFPNIFVGGDLSAISDMDNKLAQNAEIQAKIIGTNILHCHWASEKKPAKLISYESKTRIVVISLGLYDGLISFGSFSISGIIPALLKEAIEWKTLIRYWIWNEKFSVFSCLFFPFRCCFWCFKSRESSDPKKVNIV